MSESIYEMIPMRDGCRLAARIWMPDPQAEGPFPAVLEALPYRLRDCTAARDATTHPFFARSGYVCLRVDLRGCGDSDGLFDDEYSEQELSDIEKVIAWIAAQPWSNGAVGMMGISWGGFNGLQVAARRPDALKAVITLCSSSDRFADDIHFKGGCELTENIGWAATVMSWFSMPPDPGIRVQDWRKTWLDRLENTPFLASQWLRQRTRNDYWRHGSVCEDFSAVDIPVLSIGGWHDGYRNTPLKLLEGGCSGPVKAVIGPWNHHYPHIASPEPRTDFVALALRWWDRWLKAEPNGAEDDPDYRVYIMDAVSPQTSYDTRPGRWVGIASWPKGGLAHQTLILGDQTLGHEPMTKPATTRSNPACGQGTGEYFPYGFGPGELPGDQQYDDALSLCFDCAPLEQGLTLLGAPEIQLTLACDQPYGQLAARLSDVAPDGRATLISHGFLNLQFASGYANFAPLTPLQDFDIRIELDQCAYRLPQGHRLRLALSSSYWPFIWPERGTVALTLSSGSLKLPFLPEGSGREITMPAGPDTRPIVSRQLRPGSESKRRDDTDGHYRLIIETDHGETLLNETGLCMASAMREVWSISKQDVSDARAEITWTRSLSRGDWQVSSLVETEMRSDKDSLQVTMNLAAREGDVLKFSNAFSDIIPRHGEL